MLRITYIRSNIDHSRYPTLSELELADHTSSNGPTHIDILVGSDLYWTFMIREIIHVDNGPIALHTRLGWLVSGAVKTDDTIKLTHTNLAINYFDEPS